MVLWYYGIIQKCASALLFMSKLQELSATIIKNATRKKIYVRDYAWLLLIF